ncbi:MAG: hypothetical protein ACJ8AW_45395 [Rhodopila sp.]
MDSALRINTNSIISAEQLWEMDNPRAVGFVCPDCHVKLIPAACDKGRDWKVRPYFKRPEGTKHAEWCNMEARDKLVAEAARTPVLTRNPPPLPVYTRLDLAQENTSIRMPEETGAARSALRHVESAGHEPSGPFTNRHNRTAGTIRPICRQFADFPHPNDRKVRLSLPGVVATTYAAAFMPIRRAMGGGDPGCRVFYGEVALVSGLRGWMELLRSHSTRISTLPASGSTRLVGRRQAWTRSCGSYAPSRRRPKTNGASYSRMGRSGAKERARRYIFFLVLSRREGRSGSDPFSHI